MKVLRKSDKTYLSDDSVSEIAVVLSNLTVERGGRRGSRDPEGPFMLKEQSVPGGERLRPMRKPSPDAQENYVWHCFQNCLIKTTTSLKNF